MKAITIWQPWAELLAIGAKRFETRSWATAYRGPIAIHAAAKPPREVMRQLPSDIQRDIFNVIYEHYGITGGALGHLQTGAVIAVAELVKVWRIVQYPGPNVNAARYIDVGAESLTADKHAPDFGRIIVPTPEEMAFGDWTPGRYAWELANVRILTEPVKVKGQQGLWEWKVITHNATPPASGRLSSPRRPGSSQRSSTSSISDTATGSG